ncbi:UDP-N-acetylmuramoyl-L-alanine--D-glutamate ligase [Aquabacterium sp. J223]|uniref:Mur ligase family protein n=1 Tax=Aquabacterium sp. J223 TaxID=2898431 RepID=UPI0021AD7006|nr:Mur ligase family protein [Aquabacterium sp. J223]UUX95665.1 UDP-N-acetylmuramoyl-L-alanine--D-glutamate ligase [Aquabacterium sp. J223]
MLQGKHVLVLGLGDSGLAMARWCARLGAASVRVWDSREAAPKDDDLKRELPQARRLHGALDLAALLDGGERIDAIFKSPGLSPRDERLAALLKGATDRGLWVAGELELFARALAALAAAHGYAPKVLAITGTNGKTTTTALTGLLCERAGARVALAGNIGPSLLDTLAAALDAQGLSLDAPAAPAADEAPDDEEPDDDALGAELALVEDETALVDEPEPEVAAELAADEAAHAERPLPIAPPPPPPPVFEHLPEVWVLELSSFQLDGVRGFEPHAAAVLNITQDHLDWHGDMAAYAAAKGRVFGERGMLVINRDDAAVEALVPPPVVVKGARGRPGRTVSREVVRFGLDAPRAPGDFGLVVEGGMAWLVQALPSEDDGGKGRGRKAAVPAEDLHIRRLMPADALRLRGRHNAANALAALALATSTGLPLAPMLHGLREYRGEPHRVEYLATVNGIEAYDDSKGTNVGATVAAIDGLGADRAPAKLALILGGDGKGQDFAPLVEPLRRHARAVALIGRDAEALASVLSALDLPLQRHGSLPDAVRWCFAQARSGDAVLLSPACASLDMFRDYAHRAQVFADEVQAIAAEHGEALA